jgi:hypothetical protein
LYKAIPVTDKERKEFIKLLKQYRARVAKDPEEALRLLIGAGIYTKKGNLTKYYR